MAVEPLSAETIARAAVFDPQLRVPLRPRLRRGLVVETTSEQVVVTGTPTRQLFRGASATTMLPGLLNALDGRRDHPQLAQVVGVSQNTVFKALSLLWACGVVEEAAPDDVELPEVPRAVADLLSRLGDSTGANGAWEQSAARLAEAAVEVVGDDELAAAVAAELEAPLRVVRPGTAAPSPESTLVVLAHRASLTDPAHGQLIDVADRCWQQGVALLRVRVWEGCVEVGPYVDRGTTACLRCLAAADTDDHTLDPQGDISDAVELGLAAGLAARDIFALISRSTPVSLPTRWHRVNLARFASSEVSAATRSGCPVCSCAPGRPLAVPSLPARFEASVAIPPRAFADLKAHQAHYKPSNLALQRGFRSWPLAERFPLPAPALARLSGPPARQPAAVDADLLALLLATSAGVKEVGDQKIDRWTAAGGNIGSVTAYVAVRDCSGIAPGLYAYVAADHQLARLGDRLDDLAAASPVTVVLTGDYRKVAQKYAAFALRIILLDTGCALSTVRRVARWLGARSRAREQWDDDAIAASLAIAPDLEPITAVIDLGEQP